MNRNRCVDLLLLLLLHEMAARAARPATTTGIGRSKSTVPSGWRGACFWRWNRRWAVVLLTVVACVLGGIRLTSYRVNHRALRPAPLNYIERECPLPKYPILGRQPQPVLSSTASTTTTWPQICVTTLTDAEHADWWQRMVRWRNFGDLLEMTWSNKQHYCAKHGYQLFNESANLDTSRPPSWSKIRAAQRLLTEEDCDWVYWMDADTVIMNSDKRIEDFLPTPETGIDLVIARQKGPSWNAGAWLLRRSPWSLQFLEQWWNYTDHVRVKGLSVSGDNDALRTHLRNMDPTEFEAHIAVPPRCLFNSVARWVKDGDPPLDTVEELKEVHWYMSQELYHKGDLVAHVAGVDNKISTTALLLRDAV